MCVPVASCARLERHAADRIIIAFCFLSEHLQIHSAGKIIGWSFFAFWKNALAISFCRFHFVSPVVGPSRGFAAKVFNPAWTRSVPSFDPSRTEGRING